MNNVMINGRIIVFVLLLLSVPIISHGQILNYKNEKSNLSNRLRGDVVICPKYGWEIYNELEDKTLGLEFFDLGGVNGSPITRKFFITEKFPVLLYKGTPYTGKVVSYYENGKKEWENSYTKGLRNGDFFTFHENGDLKSKSKFKEDKRDGVFECYCENGAKEKGTYKEDMMVGVWEGIFPDGRLLFRSFYEYNKLISKPDSYNHPRIINGWNNQRFEIY